MWFKGITWILLFTMLMQPVVASAEDRATLPIQLAEEQPIGEGVVLQRYDKKISGNNSRVFVTKVDLTNPYAQVRPLYGKNGTFAEKQTVQAMAEENGAIAAINADFFNMKDNTPFGIVVDQGEIISSMGRMPYWHSLGILEDGTAIIDRFTYQGKVTAPSGATFTIQGVNKQEYQSNGYASHTNQLNLYTPAFGPASLGALKGYEDHVEVVVQENIVKEIRVKQGAAAIPANGFVLWGHGTAAQFLQEQFKPGDPVQVDSTHTTASNVQTLHSAMAGYLLLVKDGVPQNPVANAIRGKFSRSAVGISQDGKTLYLAAVEGPPKGRGMELVEWAVVMKEIGSYQAFNLDGGGSTTMVARQLADANLSLLNTPAYGTQRKIPTSIGIFNTAPRGAFKGMIIDGPTEVVKGSAAEFKAKGYDEHYHPFAISPNEVTWSSLDPFTGNKLLALTSGQQEIAAEYNGVRQAKTIKVIGAADVAELMVEPTVVAVDKGKSTKIALKIKTKSGKTLDVTPQGATASVTPELGTMDGFTFTAGDAEGKGEMTVNFDGLTVQVPVFVGTTAQPFESFDQLTGLYHSAVPKELANTGSFALTSEKLYRTNQSAKLNYNFSGAAPDEIRISYGILGSQPIPLPGTPIGLGLWVNGDNSGHWLRAEIVDAKGKIHYMDLAKEINFTGWNYVQGSIPAAAVYPVKLKSLYVVNAPEGTEQRPEKGTLYFDELTLYQPYDPSQQVKGADLQAEEEWKLGQDISAAFDAPVQVEPVSTIPLFTPNKKPVPYGFKITGEQAPKTVTLTPVAGKWPQKMGVGLLHIDFAKNLTTEVKGSQSQAGAWTFPLEQTGTYVPYYSGSINPFRDVLAGSWYEEAVLKMYEKGMIKGMSQDRFAPNQVLTRAQFVTLLGNWAGWKNDPSLKLEFKDQIPAYAAPAIKVAVSKGIVQGFPGNKFKPDAPLTRAQMTVMLYLALQDQGVDLTADQKVSFTDKGKIPAWAEEAVQAMAGKGYVKGIGDSFKPSQTATRAQAAVLLYQLNK